MLFTILRGDKCEIKNDCGECKEVITQVVDGRRNTNGLTSSQPEGRDLVVSQKSHNWSYYGKGELKLWVHPVKP